MAISQPQMKRDYQYQQSLVAMKEPDFVTKMVTTCDIGQQVGNNKTHEYTVKGNNQQKAFKYPENIANHFSDRHVIDNHNA